MSTPALRGRQRTVNTRMNELHNPTHQTPSHTENLTGPDAPQEAPPNTSDGPLPNSHVRECFVGKVDVIDQPGHEFPRIRAGYVDAGERSGHGRDVHSPLGMFGLQPVLDPLPDRCGAGRCRRHEIVILVEPSGDAVLAAHDAVSYGPDIEFVPRVDVDQIEQLGDVRATKVQLAQGRDVDNADRITYCLHFTRRVPVVLRPDPLSGDERGGPVGNVPVLHWRDADRFSVSTRKCTEADRSIRRAPDGGSQFRDRSADGLDKRCGRVDRLVLALAMTHRCCREPLDQLDRVVAFRCGIDDVGALDVLGVVDEAVRGRSEQGWVVGPCPTAQWVRDAYRLPDRRLRNPLGCRAQ